ncbi:uncharacterized protein CYBJADRAFT_169821 [Cyberlindnera jadinii NRRL Y-1542]|uniref:Uncharacterized protein n=2 Tax=Cyberlindnera jadinii (strain ATCC 18201 / CBS 1600 / BCRC 20928 / JCM 3617 / NBRC 0987 / NRRL Y-1542) TaxID=983966 RepID=A0A1E4RUL2_CYBJN|nr:hypothetical protein CYBJADRAFT_169821 [Cyberlindnera jadinii NRRL Y-1542]ODV70974.1 hypothetical protein CYBJADRAFT_169821 [Cyberlindnera jadinii NRRL Y-1542]
MSLRVSGCGTTLGLAVALGLAGLVVSTPRRAYSCVLLLYHTHINQSTLSSPSEELALPGGPWAKDVSTFWPMSSSSATVF